MNEAGVVHFGLFCPVGRIFAAVRWPLRSNRKLRPEKDSGEVLAKTPRFIEVAFPASVYALIGRLGNAD
jgi:hypothetical protein